MHSYTVYVVFTAAIWRFLPIFRPDISRNFPGMEKNSREWIYGDFPGISRSGNSRERSLLLIAKFSILIIFAIWALFEAFFNSATSNSTEKLFSEYFYQMKPDTEFRALSHGIIDNAPKNLCQKAEQFATFVRIPYSNNFFKTPEAGPVTCFSGPI